MAVEFKKNDRAAVQQNIQGIHAAISAITKQPVFLLSPQEGGALTKSLCDVLDYHKINITDVTGPWGLYAALAFTAFAIYKPRIDFIKRGGQVQVEQSTEPATPMEAEIPMPSGGIDLTEGVVDLSKTTMNPGAIYN